MNLAYAAADGKQAETIMKNDMLEFGLTWNERSGVCMASWCFSLLVGNALKLPLGVVRFDQLLDCPNLKTINI